MPTPAHTRDNPETTHILRHWRELAPNLTPQSRALEKVLVPLGEQVNAVSTQGMVAEQVQALRQALLTMLENLASAETHAAAGSQDA